MKVKRIDYVGGKLKESHLFNKTTILDVYIQLKDILSVLHADRIWINIKRRCVKIFLISYTIMSNCLHISLLHWQPAIQSAVDQRGASNRSVTFKMIIHSSPVIDLTPNAVFADAGNVSAIVLAAGGGNQPGAV
ncbi:MAG: hypothetical protein M0Q44_03040 [Methylobacter sp.]|nr:hypothetical protein [Methylobacter sp.]